MGHTTDRPAPYPKRVYRPFLETLKRYNGNWSLEDKTEKRNQVGGQSGLNNGSNPLNSRLTRLGLAILSLEEGIHEETDTRFLDLGLPISAARVAYNQVRLEQFAEVEWFYNEYWYRTIPRSRIEHARYKALLQEFVQWVSPKMNGQFTGQFKTMVSLLLSQRQSFLESMEREANFWVADTGYNRERHDLDIFPANYYVYQTAYRNDLSSTPDNYHLEKWFKDNPRNYNELLDFAQATVSKRNELFSRDRNLYSQDISILEYRRTELVDIAKFMGTTRIHGNTSYHPNRWPMVIADYHKESEVEIYDPSDDFMRNTYLELPTSKIEHLRGKDFTPESLVEAYNILVADRINALFKDSQLFIFNPGYHGTHTEDWYFASLDNAERTRRIRYTRHNLAYPEEGPFGIFQASARIDPETLRTTVNPDDPNGQEHVDNGTISFKNVLKALSKSITQLSRVRRCKINPQFFYMVGEQNLGWFTTYRILKEQYWAKPEHFKDFYNFANLMEGEITVESITDVFNRIYLSLMTAIDGGYDDPNLGADEKIVLESPLYYPGFGRGPYRSDEFILGSGDPINSNRNWW